MKHETQGRIAPLVLFGALAIVALNTWFAVSSVQVLVNSESWVQHTWQVIYQVELIAGSVKDAENSTRGYINTGDEGFLEGYRQASHELPGELASFGTLTADNSSQGLRLQALHGALDDRFARLETTIAMRRGGNSEGLQTLLADGAGRALSARVRRVTDAMEAEERRLLAIRLQDAAAYKMRAMFSLGLASGLDFLLIVLMFRYFSKERELRVATEKAAAALEVERLKAEAAAQEVQALNRTLEERVRLRTVELETTNRELEAFSYSVSHDLRAPLRTIDGFSLALEEDYAEAVDATGRDYIRRVRTGVQRMGQLIDALLQLSRITRAEIARTEVDLSGLAVVIAANLQEENPGRALVFEIEEGLRAEADAKLLQVALENLLGNAVKFSAKVAEGHVAFGWDVEQAAWFVRDNGAGFDMFYADKLFNAFNRLHGDKDFKGSGIGLATVARVVRRHHGRIWAHGEVGHGATFWFTLG